MRLAWCTPFAPRSAIGRFSSLVVPALRQRMGWDVDIWFPAGAGGRTMPDAGFEFTDGIGEPLRGYDAIVYNIGDHGSYHGPLVELARRFPGVLVMHDISLNNLMLGELVAKDRGDRELELRRWYGSASVRLAEEIEKSPGVWASQLESVTRYPLSELVMSAGLAVVTHSEFAADNLRRRYAGDVWRLPLPALHFDDSEVSTVALPSIIDDRPIILQAGMINRNKCILPVLSGFADSGLADRAQLAIAGFADKDELDELQRQARRHGVSGSVHVLGPVSDALLHSLRRRAVVATVLRDPCIEAASAVLLDSMAYGLAVLTVDAGHYVEVPDDAVLRVPVPPQAQDIAAALSAMIDDPQRTRAIGAHAREWVETWHTPAVYADGMAKVITEAGTYPVRLSLATDLARAVERAGFTEKDEIMRIVADTATELFAAQPRKAREILFDQA
jgi:glycosyltransferase involved in cell wall biosynthesis